MIRIATEADHSEMARMTEELVKETVYAKLFEGYTLTDELASAYTNPATRDEKICVIVYTEDMENVGFAAFDVVPWLYHDAPIKIARLSYIYLRPDFRGKGYGKEINTAFEHWGKEVGAKWLSKGNSGKNEGYSKFETIYMKEIK